MARHKDVFDEYGTVIDRVNVQKWYQKAPKRLRDRKNKKWRLQNGYDTNLFAMRLNRLELHNRAFFADDMQQYINLVNAFCDPDRTTQPAQILGPDRQRFHPTGNIRQVVEYYFNGGAAAPAPTQAFSAVFLLNQNKGRVRELVVFDGKRFGGTVFNKAEIHCHWKQKDWNGHFQTLI